MNALDGWRFAVGTLTVLPVDPPRRVDPGVTRFAMLIAAIAVLPLGAMVFAIGSAGNLLGLPSTVTSILAVGALALGTRCIHLDGLSDTVDGLTASHDAARSLEVMAKGDVGPAGAVAIFIVLGTQAAALSTLLGSQKGPVLAGLAVMASRAALALCCLRGIPSARPGGLGAHCVGSVPRSAAAFIWLLVCGVLALTAGWVQLPPWRGVVATALALFVVAALLWHTSRRLGGVTGDVFGAAIELSLAALLVSFI